MDPIDDGLRMPKVARKVSPKRASIAPRGMVGCVGRDPKGRNLCFDYNLSSCDKAPDGGTCTKGRHACFKAGCRKIHQFHKAHADDMPKKNDAE